MNTTVWLGSAALASSIPLLWWSFQGNSQKSAKAAKDNLVAGREVSYREAVLERPATERLLDPIFRRLSRFAYRFFPSTWFDRVNDRLATAGMLGRFTGEQVVGAKMLLAIVLGLLLGIGALQEPSVNTIAYLVGGVAVAWFLPDLLLSSRGDRRVRDIDRELPDILDQLTISVEAGLGFEAAMARIAEKTKSALGFEFGRTMQDIQLGVGRLDALQELTERTKSNDVRQVVLALRQAERMGVPLANTLKIQSQEMRTKRRLRAEEAAYKLPVKMIFPLGLCILPALFIVILGPAVIQISRLF